MPVTTNDPVITRPSGAALTDTLLGNVSGETALLTLATLKTSLVLAKADVGLGNVENTTAVGTVTATDATGPVTFSIVGGADAARFSITSGGVLTFVSAPDFEAPTDADTNNVYLVTVRATDSATPVNTSDQSISVTVTNVAVEAPPPAPGAMLTPTLGAVPVSFAFGTAAGADTYKWRSRVDAGAFGAYSSPSANPTGTVNVTVGTTVTIEMLATNAAGDSTATTGSITLTSGGVVAQGGGAFLANLILG